MSKVLESMGLAIGSDIAIVPAGVQGAGFQGKLSHVLYQYGLPWAFVIEGYDDQKLTVLASAAQMIYSPKPKVELDPEVTAKLEADFKAEIDRIDAEFPVPDEA